MSSLLATKIARRRSIAFIALLAATLVMMAFSSLPATHEFQGAVSFALRPIQGALKEGSGQFYWEVMIRNATNRVVKVESMVKNEKTWRPAKQESYGYFSNALGNGLPVQLRLTDTEGNTITTGDLTWPGDVTSPISLGVQFPAACMP